MKTKFAVFYIALMVGLLPARASAQTLINFDVDSNGNPVNAPSNFSSTTRLTTLYSSLGVIFSGPGGNDGGAILNQSSNFGVSALSTPNFLAFNHDSFLNDGGIPRGPETATFSFDVSTVSIFASGGGNASTFQLQAFDIGNNLIGTDTQSSGAGAFVQLSLGVAGIRSIVLTQTNGDNTYVYDDLFFVGAAVPEPTTWALIGAVTLGTGVYTWKKRRQAIKISFGRVK
jgi:hypothetical protein